MKAPLRTISNSRVIGGDEVKKTELDELCINTIRMPSGDADGRCAYGVYTLG